MHEQNMYYIGHFFVGLQAKNKENHFYVFIYSQCIKEAQNVKVFWVCIFVIDSFKLITNHEFK